MRHDCIKQTPTSQKIVSLQNFLEMFALNDRSRKKGNLIPKKQNLGIKLTVF